MSPRTGLERRDILLYRNSNPDPVGRPGRSQSLYRLRDVIVTVIGLPRGGVSFEHFDLSVSLFAAWVSAAVYAPLPEPQGCQVSFRLPERQATRASPHTDNGTT
jgi:hypothetical protein